MADQTSSNTEGQVEHTHENGLDVFSIVLAPNTSVQVWRRESSGSFSLIKLDYFGPGGHLVPIPLYAPGSTVTPAPPRAATTRPGPSTTPRSTVSHSYTVHHGKGKGHKGIKRPFEDVSSEESISSEHAAHAAEQLGHYTGECVYI